MILMINMMMSHDFCMFFDTETHMFGQMSTLPQKKIERLKHVEASFRE